MSIRFPTGGPMTSELDVLCRSCGLCCDGSLFGRVPLEPDEIEAARKNRLPLVGNDAAFAQPCSALTESPSARGDRRCSIYEERPRACRRFVCRLYERQRGEGGRIETRLERVRCVRALAAELEASGLRPADFEGGHGAGADPRVAAARPAYEELVDALEQDFARAPLRDDTVDGVARTD